MNVQVLLIKPLDLLRTKNITCLNNSFFSFSLVLNLPLYNISIRFYSFCRAEVILVVNVPNLTLHLDERPFHSPLYLYLLLLQLNMVMLNNISRFYIRRFFYYLLLRSGWLNRHMALKHRWDWWWWTSKVTWNLKILCWWNTPLICIHRLILR